jgi:hypothetical protein
MALGICPTIPYRDDRGRSVGDDGYDPASGRSIWFREDRNNAASKMMTMEAKVLCQTCPVKSDCLTYALDGKVDDGIWGGTDPKQRRAMRRKVRITSMAAVG